MGIIKGIKNYFQRLAENPKKYSGKKAGGQRKPEDGPTADEKRKQIRTERLANGLCTDCGKKAAKGKTLCQAHLIRKASYYHKNKK